MIDSHRRLKVFTRSGFGVRHGVVRGRTAAFEGCRSKTPRVVRSSTWSKTSAIRPARSSRGPYWWWLKGNVTEASITRDLEAMKRKGIAGLLMFDARGYHEDHVPPPESRMDFMGPEWRRMLKFAMSEAERLGLEMSVNLSSCARCAQGALARG